MNINTHPHNNNILRLIAGAAAVAFAASSYAATTITDSLTVTGDQADNYIFAGGDDGKSYLLTTQTSGQVRNIKMVGSAYVGTMEVNSGVDAIINFSATPIGGHSSGGSVRFRFGGSVNTVNGSATLTGAGKDVSSLSFYGTGFDTGHVASASDAERAQDTMTISHLTLNYNGTGQFGSNNLVANNSVVNVNSGYISTLTSSTTLTNSTLNYNSTNTTSKLGALSLENSAVNVNGGTLDMTSAAFDNSSITVKSGATLTQSTNTEISYANFQNITVESGGNFKASSASVLYFSGNCSIKTFSIKLFVDSS